MKDLSFKGSFKGIGKSDKGNHRSGNQDNFYVDPEGRFFIVADGMGGHAGGEEASKIATDTISNYLNETWSNEDYNSQELIQEALENANKAIIEDQLQNPERADMGTTVVLIAFREEHCWQAHIGDSRLYRLRNSKLEQITEDHTWVARAIKSGDLSQEEAKNHPWRHVLSQCLGRKDLYRIDVDSLDVESGDVFILCSDGLTEEVTDEEINKCLKDVSEDPEKATSLLIDTAKENGGSDNITVILVEAKTQEAPSSSD